MRRHRSLFSTTAALAAALLLAACGGTDDGANGERIEGADDGPSKSPSPSPSAPDVERPEITFPENAKNIFEDQETGDPTKDAVLADNAQWVNSMDDAIFHGTLDRPALRFYSRGQARQASVDYVRTYVNKDNTWFGTTRYFNREVTLTGDKKASVTYCSDETESSLKNRETGEVEATPEEATSYVQSRAQLELNEQGVWQTVYVVSNRGAEACLP